MILFTVCIIAILKTMGWGIGISWPALILIGVCGAVFDSMIK